MSVAGTEHSHWALWGTWRRGPDLVGRVAELVQDQIQTKATIEVECGRDVEAVESGDDLKPKLTGQALKQFRTIAIKGDGDELRVRIVFVRRPADVAVGTNEPRRARVKAGVVLEVTSSDRAKGEAVARAKRILADALERGRPRWVTRPALHGRESGVKYAKACGVIGVSWEARPAARLRAPFGGGRSATSSG